MQIVLLFLLPIPQDFPFHSFIVTIPIQKYFFINPTCFSTQLQVFLQLLYDLMSSCFKFVFFHKISYDIFHMELVFSFVLKALDKYLRQCYTFVIMHFTFFRILFFSVFLIVTIFCLRFKAF